MSTPAGQQDADGPNIARVYDYLLGGSHNFAADRAAAGEFVARWPDAPETMRLNRAFLGRAVRYLAAQAGIRQFLDIGSGIPTMGNVHAIAQQEAPGARVAYVDSDEVAVLHSRAILARNDNAIAIQADLRRPQEILGSQQLRTMLDLSRPVALLLVAVLHFFPDADDQPSNVAEAMEHYHQTTAPFRPRTHAEVASDQSCAAELGMSRPLARAARRPRGQGRSRRLRQSRTRMLTASSRSRACH